MKIVISGVKTIADIFKYHMIGFQYDAHHYTQHDWYITINYHDEYIYIYIYIIIIYYIH